MSEAKRHARQASKFAGVGVANTGVDFGIFALLQAAGVPPLVANLSGFVCANIFSYLMNARVTFRAPGEELQISMGGYAKFAAVHLASLAISSIFISVFADAIGAFAAKAASAVFTIAWNYAASTVFVFRRKSDNGAKA